MLTLQQADLPIVIPEQPIVFALPLNSQEIAALRIGANAFFRVIKGSAPQRDEKLPYTPHTFLPHLDHIFFLEQKLALASEDIFKDKQEAFPHLCCNIGPKPSYGLCCRRVTFETSDH